MAVNVLISILRLHVSADMRPSSGLNRAKQVKNTMKYVLNGIPLCLQWFTMRQSYN